MMKNDELGSRSILDVCSYPHHERWNLAKAKISNRTEHVLLLLRGSLLLSYKYISNSSSKCETKEMSDRQMSFRSECQVSY